MAGLHIIAPRRWMVLMLTERAADRNRKALSQFGIQSFSPNFRRDFVRPRRSISLALVVPVAFLVVLEGLVRVIDLPRFILPRPVEVLASLGEHARDLGANALFTTANMIAGLGLAALLGSAVALIVVAYSPSSSSLILRIMAAFDGIPKIALAPIIVVWAGSGLGSKIATSALLAFFPFVVLVQRGLLTAPQELVDAMKLIRCRQSLILLKLRLPWSVPFAIDAVRLAIPLAMVGAVVGEFISSEAGLGFVIITSIGRLDMTQAFAALIIVGAICFAACTIVDYSQKKLLRRFSANSNV